MMTLTPADWQSSTASLTPGLGGSWIPKSPMKTMSERKFSFAYSMDVLSQT
eukprot:CAMPEP_0115298838 /NCGR_PEP_ID=MMETSP0270-20121206/68471_1 /TAXON_ID=71861 /ORGANISM="Scrippsiella trochoidea, Strain CCMP3099" /LENGTH=50 /DNA_ID=CAMNT_0002716541 /DNA_START=17 /DNA_END=169 /DNA_ORIENTATION=-